MIMMYYCVRPSVLLSAGWSYVQARQANDSRKNRIRDVITNHEQLPFLPHRNDNDTQHESRMNVYRCITTDIPNKEKYSNPN